MNGNTPLWDAIAAKHHSIFTLLYPFTRVSNPNISGDLLCLAAKRNDLSTMMELLKHGLNIDSKTQEGLTALQIAFTEMHVSVVNFLVMNGANVDNFYPYGKTTTEMAYIDQGRFPFSILEEMMQKREVGHQVTVLESPREPPAVLRKQEDASIWRRNDGFLPRVSIYKGHPLLRNSLSKAGKLIRLPSSIEELKKFAGVCHYPSRIHVKNDRQHSKIIL